jgi:GNAT superfamily N-acetyltransferase
VSSPGFAIEPLAGKHDHTRFDCGVVALNAYLQRHARQDMNRGASTAYVLTPAMTPTEIAGFYTLTATSVRLSDLPAATIRKLPRYPAVPATLLGRVAVSVRFQGQRLGEWLLVDALKRSLEASTAVSFAAVIVDAKDDAGVRFYRRYGFEPFPEQPRRLFITMETIASLPRTPGLQTRAPSGCVSTPGT